MVELVCSVRPNGVNYFTPFLFYIDFFCYINDMKERKRIGINVFDFKKHKMPTLDEVHHTPEMAVKYQVSF